MEQLHFINVDLVMASRLDLSPIIDEFGDDIVVLNYEYNRIGQMYHLRTESSFDYKYRCPNDLSDWFCAKIEGFPSTPKTLWDGCTQRVFDLGFRCMADSTRYESSLTLMTLKRMANLKAELKITIYPVEKD